MLSAHDEVLAAPYVMQFTIFVLSLEVMSI